MEANRMTLEKLRRLVDIVGKLDDPEDRATVLLTIEIVGRAGKWARWMSDSEFSPRGGPNGAEAELLRLLAVRHKEAGPA